MLGDMSSFTMSLQESLESQFCPPLDTSLVAALISELQLSQDDPTYEESMRELRDTLTMLSIQATEDERSTTPMDDSTDIQKSSQSASTEDAESIFDRTGDTSSSSGSSTQSPSQSQTSAFTFLQASFPYMPPSRITSIIASFSTSSTDGGDVIDMERIVEHLLSEDFVRELEERGLDFDDVDSLDSAPESWQFVGKNMKKRLGGERAPAAAPVQWRRKGKGKGKGVTVTLTDVRQQHRVIKASGQKRGAKAGGNGSEGVDPWNQISSLATHLNSLLPDHSVSFFQSYFHSPRYASPGDALRAALQEIVNCNATSAEGNDNEVEASLVPILEILIPQLEHKEELDRAESAQIVADATLALSAANGSPDSVIDIVNLLKELDADVSSVQYSRGVYHSANLTSSSISSPYSGSNGSRSSNSSPSSPSVTIPGVSKRAPVAGNFPSSPLSLHSTINSTWDSTKPRRTRGPSVPTHAAFIPAYDPTNVPKRGKGRLKPSIVSGPTLTLGASRPIVGNPTSTSYGARIGECRLRRDEALMEASRYWQKGNVKTRGGEVAMFYAERAREWQEKSQSLALDDARARVEEKRMASSNRDSIDLHYTTSSEAITLAKEALAEGWVSASRPLLIVTGRGSHSVNGVGVLGPAVKKALEAEGWIVGKWNAGLIVRGKTRMAG